MWQTLTPEIICQVFEHALTNTPLLTFEPQRFPWHLGHICGVWRDVFISFPEIWTYFVIDHEQHFSASLERVQLSLEMVQLCLDRSKDCPIRFMFMQLQDSCLQSERPEFQLSLQILRRLTSHSIRWKHAHFRMDAAIFSILVDVKDRLPILDSLYLYAHRGPANLASGPLPDLFNNTPQLRHLSCYSYPLRKLDWGSLCTVHIRITERTITAAYFITLASSKLEELHISGVLPDRVLPLTFPSLKRLAVPFQELLESLSTPALEELSVSSDDFYNIPPDHPTFNRIASRFIREQDIPLKKISIYAKSMNVTKILLRYLPDSTRHVYLHSWWKETAYVLPSCSAARYLTSITFSYWAQYQNLWSMVKLAECWQRQSEAAGSSGIGPFENLEKFSIELVAVFPANVDAHFAKFVDMLKKPFEQCGVKCDVYPMPRRIQCNPIEILPVLYANSH